MVWDSLSKNEIEKIKKQIDEAAEKMIQEKEYKDFFNLTKEEVQAQLEKIKQSKE